MPKIKNQPYNCTVCSVLENANYTDNQRMVEKNLCFHCNFWDEYCQQEKLSKSIRIKGFHFMLGDKKEPDKWNGFGGRWFKIKMNNEQIIDTCDLWCQGEISKYFRDKLSDNAEFIIKE